MKHSIFTVFILLTGLTSQAQSSFDQQLTEASNIRLTVNNVGTFGNGFRGSYDLLDFASAEFPANSGIEHLFEAGIWIGGKVDGVEVVSTAAYDQSSGYSAGKAGYEFNGELGSAFQIRSSLFDSPNYSPEAVSHQDFIADFSDKNILVPGTSTPIQNHDNPMNVQVHFESYNWNYSFSDFMIICNYTVTNEGTKPIDDMYISMWSNEVVRNTNVTPAGQGGSAFYDKGGNGFIDSLNLAYCYDATGDVGFTESFIGHMFLGAEDKGGFRHPKTDDSIKANYQTWQFNSTAQDFFFPQSETQRYAKQTDGFNQWPCWSETGSPDPRCGGFQQQTIQDAISAPGNRSDLLSIGPFKDVQPGESITFAWAWVFAKKNEDGKPNIDNTTKQKANLIEHAQWAQTAYNGEDINFNGVLDPGEDSDGDGVITRFILPTPPDIPKTKIIAREKGLDIYWSLNSELSVDPITQEKDFEGYNIYLTKLGDDVANSLNLTEALKLAASFDTENNNLFYDSGFESVLLENPATFEGDSNTYHYKYSINGLVNGWQYIVAITAFDRGDNESNLESLESSLLGNNFRVFPGTLENSKFEEYGGDLNNLQSRLNSDLSDSLEQYRPYAYPNPYYAGASWEGVSTFEEDKKINFANLPKRCVIRIFTLSGDLIKTITHDENYDGSSQRWYETYSDPSKTVFSGGEHSWDLLSEDAQIIARGTYLFSVEDLETGAFWKEKFVIIK
ncbi:MAG: hypothetical protein KC456_11110 [Flavobacteriales bacterium]|jgi:hypothetical protein|nr:hypothetical protein [Flavobacteriales bacterium]